MKSIITSCFIISYLAQISASQNITPRSGNGVNVSWGDHIMVYEGAASLDTPDKIRAAMPLWKEQLDARHIFWRVSGVTLERDFVRAPGGLSKYWRTTQRIFSAFDPLSVAVDAAHANGLKIYAYLSTFDEGSPPSVLYGGKTPFPWQSKFTVAHPEYLVVDRSQKNRQYGVMEYAYPKARRYKVAQFKWFVETYPFDGIYVCTRSHSEPADFADQYGFNDPIVDAFRERYGVNILKDEFDFERWRRLRGEYLTQLFRDLRAAMPSKAILAAIPRGRYIGPPYGNMYLDWETWVKEGIVDGLVVGVVSGQWLYPNQKLSDKEKGYLSSMEEGVGMNPVQHDIENIYGPLCAKHNRLLFLNHSGYRSSDSEKLKWRGLSGFMLYGASNNCFLVSAHVPDHPSLALEDAKFTVEFWLRVRRRTQWPRVLSKYNHNLPDNSGRGWEIVLSDENHVHFRVNDGQRDYALTSSQQVPVGEWCHVACVSEGAGGKMKIYVNGKLDQRSCPAPAGVRRVPVPLHFAEYADGFGSRRLVGMLDEVRITRRPLVFEQAPEPYIGRESDTIALWKFDGGGDRFVNSAGDSALDGHLDGDFMGARTDSREGFGAALKSGQP